MMELELPVFQMLPTVSAHSIMDLVKNVLLPLNHAFLVILMTEQEQPALTMFKNVQVDSSMMVQTSNVLTTLKIASKASLMTDQELIVFLQQNFVSKDFSTMDQDQNVLIQWAVV